MNFHLVAAVSKFAHKQKKNYIHKEKIHKTVQKHKTHKRENITQKIKLELIIKTKQKLKKHKRNNKNIKRKMKNKTDKNIKRKNKKHKTNNKKQSAACFDLS